MIAVLVVGTVAARSSLGNTTSQTGRLKRRRRPGIMIRLAPFNQTRGESDSRPKWQCFANRDRELTEHGVEVVALSS